MNIMITVYFSSKMLKTRKERTEREREREREREIKQERNRKNIDVCGKGLELFKLGTCFKCLGISLWQTEKALSRQYVASLTK